MSPTFVAAEAAALKPAKRLCPWLALKLLRVVQPPRVAMPKQAQAIRLAASLVRRLTARATSLLAAIQAVIQTALQTATQAQRLQVVLAQRVRVIAARHLQAGRQTTRLVTLERYANDMAARGPPLTETATALKISTA